MQWIGLALLGIVAISLTAALYLSISAKTSIAGREIQDYQSQKNTAEQSIAVMKTNLAEITSSIQMAKRAQSLGFKEINPENFEYLVIPGYSGKPSARLAPETYTVQIESDVITSDFTQSLWEWILDSYIAPSMDH